MAAFPAQPPFPARFLENIDGCCLPTAIGGYNASDVTSRARTDDAVGVDEAGDRRKIVVAARNITVGPRVIRDI
jgi:hypothetical protein